MICKLFYYGADDDDDDFVLKGDSSEGTCAVLMF